MSNAVVLVLFLCHQILFAMDLAIFGDQPEVSREPDFYGVGGQDLTIGMCSQEKICKIGIALKISNFTDSDTWIIDSSASDHMTFDKSFFGVCPHLSYMKCLMQMRCPSQS